MPPRQTLLSLTPAFQRRLAKTPLRRKATIPQTILSSSSTSQLYTSRRSLHTSLPTRDEATQDEQGSEYLYSKREPTSLHAKFLAAGGRDVPSPSALSALLSRLSLPADPRLHGELIACLTHPSYNPQRMSDFKYDQADDPRNNNELLANLGNEMMGMFASEHLAIKFPLLPTEILKMAVTAYVGPVASASVARELGISPRGGADSGLIGKGQGRPSAGLHVRWLKNSDKLGKIPTGARFAQYTLGKSRKPSRSSGSEAQAEEEGESDDGAEHTAKEFPLTFESVVASTVHAMVGLIYQEQGIHAAREFVTAHFLSRHLDVAALFNFTHPKKVLSMMIQRHMSEQGILAGDKAGNIITRVLAESGINTVNPLINLGLFLPSGIKLAEGFGSSYTMAEHRASTNALLSLFLVRGDQQRQIGSLAPLKGQLPTSVHVDFPVDLKGVARAPAEEFEGDGFGGLETNEESSKKRARAGRVVGASKVIPTTG